MKIFVIVPPPDSGGRNDVSAIWFGDPQQRILDHIAPGAECLISDSGNGYADELFGNGQVIVLFNAGYSPMNWVELAVERWTKAGFQPEVFDPNSLS